MSNIDIITTVYNEEDNILQLIDSVLSQSLDFNKFIIVDAGSKDRTNEIIKKCSEKTDKIKLIIKEKANVAEGRNIAIQNSDAEIIAVTDGGCVLDKDWLNEITKPIRENRYEVVGGGYYPLVKNKKQMVITALSIKNLKCEKWILPSSRSICFKKKVWESVGGYPTFLKTAEDTHFDNLIISKGYEIGYNGNAKVFWEPRRNYKQLFKQAYLYDLGDGRIKLVNRGLITSFVSIIIFWLSLFLTLFEKNILFMIPSIFIETFLYTRNIHKYNSFKFEKRIQNYMELLYIYIALRYVRVSGHIKGRITGHA